MDAETAELARRLDGIERHLAQVTAGLDDLGATLEGALSAQARRVEAVIGGAGRDTVPAGTPAGQQPAAMGQFDDEAVEAVTTSVVDAVQVRLSAAGAAEEDRLDRVETALQSCVAPIETLTGAVEALRATVTTVRDEAAEDRQRVDRLAARVESLVGVAGSQATEAGRRVDTAAAALEVLGETLVEYLEDRDRHAAIERAALTQAFVDQLADALPRRERRRLARRIEIPEREVDAPEVAPPQAEAPQVETPGATGDVPSPVAAAPAPPAPPPPGTTLPASRQRVQPSLRDRPVRAGASLPRDPAGVRRTLAGVRGLGPSRQAALVDAFDTLEAIREASDEQLLAVRGIGPSLLPAIRDAVR